MKRGRNFALWRIIVCILFSFFLAKSCTTINPGNWSSDISNESNFVRDSNDFWKKHWNNSESREKPTSLILFFNHFFYRKHSSYWAERYIRLRKFQRCLERPLKHFEKLSQCWEKPIEKIWVLVNFERVKQANRLIWKKNKTWKLCWIFVKKLSKSI